MQDDSLSYQPPPRNVTGRARWAALTEPRVRAWWLTAIVLGVIGLKFVIVGVRARAHEIWLIENGKRIDATIEWAGNEHLKNRHEAPDSVVQLQFQWDGKPYEPRPAVLEGRKDFITTASTVPIHVNPGDPEDWTWLDAPLPLLSRVIGGIITLPMALLALLWALVKYARTRRAWRSGMAIEALVVDTRIGAIAPLCRAIRVTPDNDDDKRIYTVFVPRGHPDLVSGDMIFILRPSPRSKSAVAAAWFERQ
jgi:hypothetical protein